MSSDSEHSYEPILANLFTPSELLVFRFSVETKLSAEELKKMIGILKHPQFQAKDIDHNVYQKFQKLIQVLSLMHKCFTTVMLQ